MYIHSVEPPALAQISPLPRLIRVREQSPDPEPECDQPDEPEEDGMPWVFGDVGLDCDELVVQVLKEPVN